MLVISLAWILCYFYLLLKCFITISLTVINHLHVQKSYQPLFLFFNYPDYYYKGRASWSISPDVIGLYLVDTAKNVKAIDRYWHIFLVFDCNQLCIVLVRLTVLQLITAFKPRTNTQTSFCCFQFYYILV